MAKNIFELHMTPIIMTSSTGDIIKKAQFLFGLLIYTFMQNFRRIAPVAKEIETTSQKSGILINYDVIIKQTKKLKFWKFLFFHAYAMLFSVCRNSIGKYDFYTVALYAPLRVLQVAKSTVLLGFNAPKIQKGQKSKVVWIS